MAKAPDIGKAAIRSPRDNGKGGIDCEIEHPAYGWIPFTAVADDVEQHARQIYVRALQMRPAAYVPPPPPTPEKLEAAAQRRADKRMAQVMELAEAMGVTLDPAEARANLIAIEQRK